ncbi:3-keto-disaccharide hydrolase, partial [Staphylococcus aureus]
LKGWRVGKNASSIKVENGKIVVNGPVAHLFYDGPVANHDFKNFELKVDVMTTPGSNSGIYFHTVYQEESWPSAGYEVQVNNSHT